MRNSPSQTAEPSGSCRRMKRPVASSVPSSSAVPASAAPAAAAKARAAGPWTGVEGAPVPGAMTSAPSATAKGASRAGAGISARRSSFRHRAFLRVPKAWRKSGGTWSSAFTLADYGAGRGRGGRLAVNGRSPCPSVPVIPQLTANGSGERINILLRGVKGAHPADLPCCLIPVVEPEGSAQPVRHAGRKDDEDAVGFGFLGGADALDGVDGGTQPGCHGVRVRSGAQPEAPFEQGDELG